MAWLETMASAAGAALAAAAWVSSRLRPILEQVLPNEGSSLRDAVDRIEGELAGLGSWHRASLDLTDLALIRADHDGAVQWASRRWVALTGYTVSESRGNGWLAAVHDEDRVLVRAQWAEAIADRRPAELRFRVQHHRSGQLSPVLLRLEHVREGHGFLGRVEVEVEAA